MNLTTNLNLLHHIKTSSPPLFIQALVLLALIAILARKSKPFKTKPKYQLPPGPPSWPIIGNMPEMLVNRPTFKWIHRIMEEMKVEIACFRLAGVHVVCVTNDEIAREALREKDAVFATRPKSFAVKTLSEGYKNTIFTPYGEQWRKMRKVLVSEINNPRRLNWLHGRRAEEADNLLAYVSNLYNRSKLVDVRHIARHYCHSVTMRLAFGNRYFGKVMPDGGPGPTELEHTEATFTALENIFAFSISDYIPCLTGLNMDGREKKLKDANETLDRCHNPIIKKRIELWRKKGGKKEVEDWLDILIALKNDDGTPLLTPREVKAEIKDIMIAAIDNPTNNVEWVLAEMLAQPEILRKAVDEIDSVVGKDRLVQESDIPNLNYVKACSREGYRKHPIAPFLVPHVALADTTLAGYFIPKGSHLLISRVGLGQNPKIWNEPHLFKPERHLSGNGGLGSCGSNEVVLTEPDMRFVSFSTGRRGCVAGKLGTFMNVMLLARLLQGFNWSLPDGNGPVPGRVDLAVSDQNMLKAKPLVARVEFRLAPELYPKMRY